MKAYIGKIINLENHDSLLKHNLKNKFSQKDMLAHKIKEENKEIERKDSYQNKISNNKFYFKICNSKYIKINNNQKP